MLNWNKSLTVTFARLRWLLLLGMCFNTALAYAQPQVATDRVLGNVGAIPALATPNWEALSPAQQEALHPLANSWPDLSDVQKRKWIALVKNFATLPPSDQLKIQNRMSAWAALKPSERERARENFAASKQARTSSKAEKWEEYQALPQSERDELAFQVGGKKKRSGAAKIQRNSSTSNPDARATPISAQHYPSQTERSELMNLIHPNTLLPLAGN